VDLTDSTLTIDGCMWTISSRFQGIWLDIEAINSRPDGSFPYEIYANVENGVQVQYALSCSDHNALCLSVVKVSLDTTYFL
jgi:hypothetical protein